MNRGKSWDIHGNSQDLQKTNELISSEQQFSKLNGPQLMSRGQT